MRVRIGTRGSALALVQSKKVENLLKEAKSEILVSSVVISTRGDKITDHALHEIGGKGLFVREIEQALLDDRIDLAVHSLKDLPTELPPELTVSGTLPRDDPRDALVSSGNNKFIDLPSGVRIGTSSLRRRS